MRVQVAAWLAEKDRPIKPANNNKWVVFMLHPFAVSQHCALWRELNTAVKALACLFVWLNVLVLQTAYRPLIGMAGPITGLHVLIENKVQQFFFFGVDDQ